MVRTIVEKDRYYDSVFLMQISRKVKELEGVVNAVVSMGTEMNRALLKEMGYGSKETGAAAPNDLLIVIESEDPSCLDRAAGAAYELLNKKKERETGKAHLPKSLRGALNVDPDANLAVISLPGEYAAGEARRALELGLNVMLFSDNVSVESEIALKDLALEKGLLMMGPDCGTAIINGQPLCFANLVAPGNIGIVGASGTGIQEVTCCIDRLGGGISQAIGTGGRDLKEPRVGGRMMLTGIEALKRDPSTGVIAVISKPPAPTAAAEVLNALEQTGKPAVVHFIGQEKTAGRKNLRFAESLEDTAVIAAALSGGGSVKPPGPSVSQEEIRETAEGEARRMHRDQKYLRGLYTGGTLADEALFLLEKALGPVYSNNQKKTELQLRDPHVSTGHTVVDLGDDLFTAGRPHPMIDPGIRAERIRREGEDPAAAVILLDMVLGFGSHPDPAGAVLASLKEARDAAAARGGYLPVIVSVVGTRQDFQGYDATVEKLRSAGCLVMPTNYQAALMALEIVRKAGSR